MKKTTAEMPATEKPEQTTEPEIPIGVQDAWADVYNLSQGIEQLLSAGASHTDGLAPEALQVLRVAQDHILNRLDLINGYFRPGKEGGVR